MAHTPLRVGLVGLGLVTQLVHLPLLRRDPSRFAIAGLCDLSAPTLERVGDTYGVAPAHRHHALADLLAQPGLDALLVLTSGSHGAAVAAAQAAGLAVLCEKPLAYTLAEADAIRDDPPVLLGYMKLHDPAVRAARRAVGGLGPLRSVEALVLHPSTAVQMGHLELPTPPVLDPGVLRELEADADARRVSALGQPAALALGRIYSDLVLGSLVHDLALLRYLVGGTPVIDHVAAWPEGVWPPSLEVNGELGGELRFALRWHYLPDAPAYHEELRIHGEHGSLTLRFPTPYVLHAPTELTVTERSGTGEACRLATAHEEAFEEQLRHFHRVVTAGEAPLVGPREGRADIVTCQRIARRLAAQRGIVVGGEAVDA